MNAHAWSLARELFPRLYSQWRPFDTLSDRERGSLVRFLGDFKEFFEKLNSTLQVSHR